MNFVTDVLRRYGFEYVDYVYVPGQYAVRCSIIDVFSFSSEYPFRIDFFGDEVESIRTFEVETQLSNCLLYTSIGRAYLQLESGKDFCQRTSRL